MSVGLYACIHSYDDDDRNNSSGSANNLKKGQIEIKVYPNKDNKVVFYATTSKITIDWGDGYIDRLTPNGVSQTFSHTYANQNLQTIYIESEKLTRFICSYYERTERIKELYFGEVNEIERIDVRGNGLTVLEIKKANALKEVDCSYNRLTCNTLNSLFESLPNRPAKDGKYIIRYNSTSECSVWFEIAIDKGWKEVANL